MKKLCFFSVIFLILFTAFFLSACSSSNIKQSYQYETIENGEDITYSLTFEEDGSVSLVRSSPYRSVTYFGTYSIISEGNYIIKIASSTDNVEIPLFLQSAKISLNEDAFYFTESYTFPIPTTDSGNNSTREDKNSDLENNPIDNQNNQTNTNPNNSEISNSGDSENQGNQSENNNEGQENNITQNVDQPGENNNSENNQNNGNQTNEQNGENSENSNDPENPIEPECVHSWVKESNKEPTCTEDGYLGKEYCSICGSIKTERTVLLKKGHCYENGVCTVCGYADLEGTYIGEGSSLDVSTVEYSSQTTYDYTLVLEEDHYVLTEITIITESYAIEARDDNGVLNIVFLSGTKEDINAPEAEENGYTRIDEKNFQKTTGNIKERIELDNADPGVVGIPGFYIKITTNEVVSEGGYTFELQTRTLTAGERSFLLDLSEKTCTEIEASHPVFVQYYVNGYKVAEYNFSDKSDLNNCFAPLSEEYSVLTWYDSDEYTVEFDYTKVTTDSVNIYARKHFFNTFVYNEIHLTFDDYTDISDFSDVEELLFAQTNETFIGSAGYTFEWMENNNIVEGFTVPVGLYSLDTDHTYFLTVATAQGYAKVCVTYGSTYTYYYPTQEALDECTDINGVVSLLELDTALYEYSGSTTSVLKTDKVVETYYINGYFVDEFTVLTVNDKDNVDPDIPAGYLFMGYKIGDTVYQNLDSLQISETAFCVYKKENVTAVPTADSTGTYTIYIYIGNILSTETEDIPALNETDYEYSVTLEPTLLTTGEGRYVHTKYGTYCIELSTLTTHTFISDSVEYTIIKTGDTMATLTYGGNTYDCTISTNGNALTLSYQVDSSSNNYLYAVSVNGDFFTYSTYENRAGLASGGAPSSRSFYTYISGDRYIWGTLSDSYFIYDSEDCFSLYEGIQPEEAIYDDGHYIQGNVYISFIGDSIYFSNTENLPICEEVNDFSEYDGKKVYPIKDRLTLNEGAYTLVIDGESSQGNYEYDEQSGKIYLYQNQQSFDTITYLYTVNNGQVTMQQQ